MFQSSITKWLTKTSNRETSGGSQSSSQTSLSPATSTSLQTAAANIRQAETRHESGEQPSTSFRSLSSAIPVSNVEISSVTEDILPQFRRLISVLLPVPYSERFFAEILTDPVISSVSLVALWKDETSQDRKVVAGIRCRVLVSSSTESVKRKKDGSDEQSLYISTLGTLAPFRNHGIATMLLRETMWNAARQYGISTVTAHVWEANEEAREWYAKLGFQEVKYDPHYYRKLRPTGAWLLERRVLPSDFLNISEDR